jgi:1-acyl-sn-glycerol-3-phosphate acyltransferase
MSEVLAFLIRLVAGVQAVWFDSQPGNERQCIFIANHTSHLDFLVLWAALPARVRAITRPVAARDYWSSSALRRFLAVRVFRALLIDRKSAGAGGDATLRPMLEALEQGSSLILFPEGTRGTGDEIAPFKSGIYHLCRLHSGLELSPVYLDNLNRILPKGEILMAPLLSRAHFGPRIRLEDGEEKAAYLTRVREAVLKLRGA